MVGVQEEQHVEGALDHRVGVVAQLGHAEHHAQEVADVGQLEIGVHERQPVPLPMRERGERRHLAEEAQDLPPSHRRVVDVRRLGIERRERRHGAHEHAHGMGVVVEPVDEARHVLVDQRVAAELDAANRRAARRFGSSPSRIRYATSR